tara:strand:+ start:577 stop:852 length:276 start_codon:yes stop_codon:yes gene_type:complete
MSTNKHYKAFEEGINRASLIRKDLHKHPTEYYPEKVRGLNKAYIETIKEIIRQGEKFLDSSDNFLIGLKVASTIENYRAFLSTLPRRDETN